MLRDNVLKIKTKWKDEQTIEEQKRHKLNHYQQNIVKLLDSTLGKPLCKKLSVDTDKHFK